MRSAGGVGFLTSATGVLAKPIRHSRSAMVNGCESSASSNLTVE